MKGLWVPVSGAIAQQKNVDAIANNVANVKTPGFKKDQLVFREYLSAYQKGSDINLPAKEWSPADFYRTYGAEKGQVEVDGSYTLHSQGQIIPTKNPFDLALRGLGFFEILTPNGVRYTRRGVFALDKDRRLVTSEGFPVLSNPSLPVEGEVENPSERAVIIPRGDVLINRQGILYNQGKPFSQLAVVEFSDTNRLLKDGSSFFANDNPKNIVREDIRTTVYQGAIEESNVNAITEMSALIKAHRQFESLQRVIKAYDEMAGKAANEIARF